MTTVFQPPGPSWIIAWQASQAKVRLSMSVGHHRLRRHRPLEEVLRLAQQSKPFLAIFDHAGMPLHLGRSERLANSAQRLALIATERGCTRPGCNAPATMTAVHHITEWAHAGRSPRSSP
ncbi:HNH endonuclease signature motif containing protein [Nocardia sp. NPDC004711]